MGIAALNPSYRHQPGRVQRDDSMLRSNIDRFVFHPLCAAE
jgi:hypothetical protein